MSLQGMQLGPYTVRVDADRVVLRRGAGLRVAIAVLFALGLLPPLGLAVDFASRGRSSEAVLGMGALGVLVFLPMAVFYLVRAMREPAIIEVDRLSRSLVWGRRTFPGQLVDGIQIELSTWKNAGKVIPGLLVVQLQGETLRAPLGVMSVDAPEPAVELAKSMINCLTSTPSSSLRGDSILRVVQRLPPAAPPIVGVFGLLMVLVGGPLCGLGVWAVDSLGDWGGVIILLCFVPITLYGLDLVFRSFLPRSEGDFYEGKLGLARAFGGLVLFGGLLITVGVVAVLEWRKTGYVPAGLLYRFLVIMAPAGVVGARVIRRRWRPAPVSGP